MELKDRRPLKSRERPWAQAWAQKLSQADVTPNQISLLSVIFAALAGAAYALSAQPEGHFGTAILLLIGALGCQLRLLCNLLDGMVAVEGGKAAADGGLWNEAPDRIADVLIFVGIGWGIGSPALGWAAASMAVFTAYARALGADLGLASDFSGPMAKQHRMALVTGATVLAMFEPLWLAKGSVLSWALWIIAIGAAITTARRLYRIRQNLLHAPRPPK